MSILDARAEFSDAQAVTATAISTNVMDLKGGGLSPNTTGRFGAPAITYLVIAVGDTAIDASGAATVVFSLESAENAALSTNPVVHFATAAIGKAALTKGKLVAAIPLPAGEYKEFLGVRYTVATGPLTAGNFNAFLTKDPNLFAAFNDGKPVEPAA